MNVRLMWLIIFLVTDVIVVGSQPVYQVCPNADRMGQSLVVQEDRSPLSTPPTPAVANWSLYIPLSRGSQVVASDDQSDTSEGGATVIVYDRSMSDEDIEEPRTTDQITQTVDQSWQERPRRLSQSTQVNPRILSEALSNRRLLHQQSRYASFDQRASSQHRQIMEMRERHCCHMFLAGSCIGLEGVLCLLWNLGFLC